MTLRICIAQEKRDRVCILPLPPLHDAADFSAKKKSRGIKIEQAPQRPFLSEFW